MVNSGEEPKIDAGKLIPWRDRIKGPASKLSLMKMVIVKGVHLKKGTTEVNSHWRLLIGELLRQPEWKYLADQMPNMALIEERIFKGQLNKIVDEVLKLHGWGKFAGTTGNLSGKEGDLDDLSSQVRQILMDDERRKEEKEREKISRRASSRRNGCANWLNHPSIEKAAAGKGSKREDRQWERGSGVVVTWEHEFTLGIKSAF
jgi:hypothetical protein